jgi:hypothetical protein
MSIISGLAVGSAAGVFGNIAANAIQSIFVRPRNIAGFTADVTIREKHQDVLTVTRHPVAQGSTIADHSYKEPATVWIECGWSNSNLLAVFNLNYVQTIYEAFLALQASRVLFSIVTGKRAYSNMQIVRLLTETDKNSENILLLQVECQEIILASTSTVSVPPSSSMASPAVNGGVQPTGTAQLSPATTYNPKAGPQ